jgi:hypothetical protein
MIMNTSFSNTNFKISTIITILYFIMTANNYSQQQISIGKIDNMPNMPAPYLMRDWKQVTAGYDAFVFNLNLTGQDLPLIWADNQAINYSGPRFGLHTVVGTTSPTSAEAINCIPAVVGASLVGIDKNNQNGYNWVAMCKEWFNKRNGLMVFQNSADGQTTDDWWYETMPNVFFYQLYSQYPNTDGFSSIFTSVADQMLKSVYAMGGSTTPWKMPSMNYQGWDYAEMAPSALHEHNEPEAAGAIAWLLYNAYKETRNSKYRAGAELSMEYLNSLTANPSYELQLPYGVYLAARMNAELGTNYDINKMINWCFNSDNIRNWGVMSNSNWGGYDADGLIGEINSSTGYGYPFTMNTFELVGTLVPMVRYDSRFATAIGKWALNAANACRLFYPEFLPTTNQDPASKLWADQYDTNSFIAHESMHQFNPSNSVVSPYATGDAENGGWGRTNLALYGSSHVGILGAIIDTTNVLGILRLDLLKTDYFHDNAFPTYLYYNPFSSNKLVQMDLGSGSQDVYDVVSKSFLVQGASGIISISVPSNSPVLAVVTPSGGTQTYDTDKLLINGVVVDYHSGKNVADYPPRIKSLTAVRNTILLNDSVKIYCTAADRDNIQLSFQWSASGGNITGSGNSVTWLSPNAAGMYIISCTVKDSSGAQVTASDTITVVKSINLVPVISKMTASPRKINNGASSIIKCLAIDADNDTLNYTWSALSGKITGSGSNIVWTSPVTPGNYYVSCIVNDGKGGTVSDSINLEVRNLSIIDTGQLEAYYRFNGNTNDASGKNNNGINFNATLTADRLGSAGSAYFFDGSSAYIQVPVSPSLNFQNAITINFWMKVSSFYTREQYILSQGSYSSRLKISIIPNNSLRWTIHTNSTVNSGITDLDSETKLVQDSLYNVTVLYNGSDYELYLNGNLDSFSSWAGSILQTTIPLTIAQMLPDNNNYNFRGVLDDIRIYNYALPVSEIENLANITTAVKDKQVASIPKNDLLMQNYPNPFNPTTTISWQLAKSSRVQLKIYDVLGNEVTTLVNEYQSAGLHSISYNPAAGGSSGRGGYASGVYFSELKIDSGTFYKKMVYLK